MGCISNMIVSEIIEKANLFHEKTHDSVEEGYQISGQKLSRWLFERTGHWSCISSKCLSISRFVWVPSQKSVGWWKNLPPSWKKICLQVLNGFHPFPQISPPQKKIREKMIKKLLKLPPLCPKKIHGPLTVPATSVAKSHHYPPPGSANCLAPPSPQE